MIITVCKICGCAEVQRKEWVEINSRKICDPCSEQDIKEDNWCPKCEEHVEIIDFKIKEKVKKLGSNRSNEITAEQAVQLWNDKAIYAYDESRNIDWQINNMNQVHGAYQVIDEALRNGCIFFID